MEVSRRGLTSLGTWFARHSSRYNDDITPLQSLWELVWPDVSGDLRPRLDVAEVGSDPGSPDDIVEGETADQGTLLQQKSHRLAYTTGSPQHCNLGTRLEIRVKVEIEIEFFPQQTDRLT